MGGYGQLWVPPSSFTVPPASQSVPTSVPLAAGYPDGVQILSGTNIAQPNNLTAPSPPTLLEEFEIYSVSIPWALANLTSAEVKTIAELQLLVNGRRVADFTSEQAFSGAPSFSADLTNPVIVAARDRLGLKVVLTIATATVQPVLYFMLGATYSGKGNGLHPESWTLGEPTISYRMLDVPASRRL